MSMYQNRKRTLQESNLTMEMFHKRFGCSKVRLHSPAGPPALAGTKGL